MQEVRDEWAKRVAAEAKRADLEVETKKATALAAARAHREEFERQRQTELEAAKAKAEAAKAKLAEVEASIKIPSAAPEIEPIRADDLMAEPEPKPVIKDFKSNLLPEEQPDPDEVIKQAQGKVKQEYGNAVTLVIALLHLAMGSPSIAVNLNCVLIFAIKPLRELLAKADINTGYAGYLEQLKNRLQAHINAVNTVLEIYFGYGKSECKEFLKNQQLFEQIRTHLMSDAELAPIFAECFNPYRFEEYQKQQKIEAAERQARAAEAAEYKKRAIRRNIAKVLRREETLALLVPVLGQTITKPIAERIAKRIANKYGDAPSAEEGIIQAAVGKLLRTEQLAQQGHDGDQIHTIIDLAMQLARAAGLSEDELEQRLEAHKAKEAAHAAAQQMAASFIDGSERARPAAPAAKNGGGKKGKPDGMKGRKKKH